MVSVRKKLELVCEMMNEKLERKGMSPLNLKLVAFGMLIHNMSNRNDGSSTHNMYIIWYIIQGILGLVLLKMHYTVVQNSKLGHMANMHL